MSNKKGIIIKTIIAFIIIILAVLGFNTTSNAYYVGQSLQVNMNQYLSSTNIFCFERLQLINNGTIYSVVSNVRIDGNVSTDHTGKQIASKENSKLAYIMSADNGNDKEHGPLQNAIWAYGYTWMNVVGAHHAGLYRSFAMYSPDPVYYTLSGADKLIAAADNYANQYESMEMKDNTNKEKLKVDAYIKDGKEYVRVGPFNWTLPGKITKIELKDQNGNNIDEVLYSSFSGNTEYWYGADGIQSNKDFYISVPLEDKITKIKSIKAEAEADVKGVNMWFLEGGYSQNLMISEPFTSKKQLNLELNDIQLSVKLSGYVWVDKISGKQSTLNGLYKDNDYDSNDILLDGITVRLKDKTNGNTERETKTANGGAYEFDNVLLGKLDDYYVEFEYDGLTYSNVIPHIDKDNGSKSAENENVRDEFNKNFSVVEGRTFDTGFTRDVNGNEKHNLAYNIDKNAHTSTLINNGQYTITANTNETGYYIKDHFTYGQEEIKYINLGLYEREQPNIALMKDIENVRVAVNGYNHTYVYSQRFLNQGEYGDGFNVGVKFGNKYGNMSYTRAIYKADYEYINENDKSKELKVYITYRLSVKNRSTTLVTEVKNIVDYYDSRYSVVAVGKGLDDVGNVTNNIQYENNGAYNSEYSKITINNNSRLNAQSQEDIYVQFELNREAVINILNDGENLDNVAEINSYSVFDQNGKVYAGIDMNSNPANAIPGDTTTYQDDTDSSPALKLEVADARELTGKVFLDSTTGELMTGKVRQGSGAYEEGETGIQGVKVTLTENTGSGKVYETETDANGDFYISGYIPGDYTLTYTWGDKTYTVQNYKGTVYDSSRDQNNKEWYKQNVDTRKTDALDDYQTRLDIDKELQNIKYNTVTTIDKMNSTTPTMGIGVEYETTYTASSGDRYTYRIRNVDFGIVERARQAMDLSKRVGTFKVTLANGQVIVDTKIEEDENGNRKLTGQKSYVTYMGPSSNLEPANGFVRVELDNELIQGATVEVGYIIKATNISELDYLSENFYKYGIIEDDVVTIEPTGVIDYLDSDWGFDQDKNQDWKVVTVEEVKSLVAEVVYNSEESNLKNTTILYTEKLKGQKLEPTKSAEVTLNVSKILSTSEDIELGNETEIVEINKTGGSDLTTTPGNYVPGTGKTETDDSTAETVIVTPSTGANYNFIIPIAIGIGALVILGVGIYLIKRKTLNK